MKTKNLIPVSPGGWGRGRRGSELSALKPLPVKVIAVAKTRLSLTFCHLSWPPVTCHLQGYNPLGDVLPLKLLPPTKTTVAPLSHSGELSTSKGQPCEEFRVSCCFD